MSQGFSFSKVIPFVLLGGVIFFQGCRQEERLGLTSTNLQKSSARGINNKTRNSLSPTSSLNILNSVNGVLVPRNAVQGNYIIRLKGTLSTQDFQPLALEVVKSQVSQLILDNALKTVKVSNIYRAAIKGFSAQMTASEASQLAKDPRVKMVVQDQWAVNRAERSTIGYDGNDVFYELWGLDRIDQTSPKLNEKFTSTYDGTGVHVYVVDEGVFQDHDEWAGRWAPGFDAAPPATCESEQDGNYGNGYIKGACARDHATHVAGTLAGKTFGVASGATLHSVRVWNCCSRPLESNLIKGLDWVAANRMDPAVVNFSQGLDGPGPLLDAAIEGLWNSGVFVAVAAGNSGDDACQYSPNTVSGPLIVGGINEGDHRRAASSNGPCVDLWAPGGGIHSSGMNQYGNIYMSYRMDGTSMAAPHVAGVAATYLQANPKLTPNQIKSTLLNKALSGVVSGDLAGAANLLLQSTVDFSNLSNDIK